MRTFLWLCRRVYDFFWRWSRWLFGAAKKSTGLSPKVYQILRLLVLALFIGLAAYFSPDLPGGRNVSGSPFVRRYYYGIVLFLVYVFVRLVLYVINLFRRVEASEFPDIDEAWRLGLKAFHSEGVNLRDVPVFLVLGLKNDEEAPFFAGAKLNTSILAPGIDLKGAPLRFFANHDALFITLSGIAAVNRQHSGSSVGGQNVLSLFHAAPSGSVKQTISPNSAPVAATLQPGYAAAAQTLQPGASFQTGGTLQPGHVSASQSSQPQSTQSELSREDLDRCDRRLEYLCRLISRERAPFCPINGVLLVVPVEAAETMSQTLLQDIRRLHEDLNMLFPILVVFSGLDRFPGMQEFVQRSSQVDPRFHHHLRAGSHFAHGHPIDAQAADWVVNRGVDWFRRWIYSCFAHDPSASSNPHLYQLLCHLEQKREPLARLLATALGGVLEGESVRLTGCYFTKIDPATRRFLFLRDVLTKLIEEQDEVAWSAGRIQFDERCRTWIVAAYSAVTGLAVADGYLLWKILSGR